MGGMPVNATWDLDSFRYGNNDGAEHGTGARSWMAAVNTTPPDIKLDTEYRLRTLIEETAGSNQAEQPIFTLQFRRDTGGGFGAWADVGDVSDTALPVRIATAKPANLAVNPEDFTQSNWVTNNVSVTGNDATAPDGTTTADLLTDDGTNDYHQIYDQNVLSGQRNDGNIYNRSIFVKKGSLRYTSLSVAQATSSAVSTWIYDFDDPAWELAGSAGEGESFNDEGDGWVRLSWLDYVTTTSNDDFTVGFSNGVTRADTQYAGGSNTMHVWGASITEGATLWHYHQNTTQILGSGTFNDGKIEEVNAAAPQLAATAGNDQYENEYSLIFSSTATTPAAVGDVFEFRLIVTDGNLNTLDAFTTNGGTYSVVPSVTVASGGAFTLTADSGSYTLSGQAAGLVHNRVLTADPGSYTLAGQDAVLSRGRVLTADAGSYTLTGQAAALRADRVLVCAAGNYTLAGQAAGLTAGRALLADSGSYALAGQDAVLAQGRALIADAGSYTLTGQTAALRADWVLDCEAGSYTLAGQDVGLVSGRVLVVDSGAYVLSGQVAGLRASRVLAADSATYALTGQDAALIYDAADPVLAAEAGAYALTGQSAGLNVGRSLAADPGIYALTGQAATLAADRQLSADNGAYVLTGQVAQLGAGRLLIAEAGNYIVTGQAAGLVHGRVLAADVGAYALNGQDVSLIADRAFAADAGSYVLNGQDAALIHDAADPVLTAESGAYALTGQAAGLAVDRVLTAQPGSYNLSGQAAALGLERVLNAEPGSYIVTGQDAVLVHDMADPVLAADAGAYVLTGNAAGLRADRLMAAGAGNYALTGQTAGLAVDHVLDADFGTYALTGQDAALRADRLLMAGFGTYNLTGFDVALLGPGEAVVPSDRRTNRVEADGRTCGVGSSPRTIFHGTGAGNERVSTA